MSTTNWNSPARVHASERWRRPSAAMGRALTEAIVAEARVDPGMRVLDVASGTGEPAISIATQLNGTGRVVATDISPEPLQVGAGRARERGLTNIEFAPADVHQLPFAADEFDRVTCRLGVMFFADLPRALGEIHRVLKSGGRATLLAWGPMEQPYFETTLGTILRLVPGSSIPASGMAMFKFGRSGTLTRSLETAGFATVEEKTVALPWNWPGTPEELWEYFQEVTVPFKPMLQAIPPEPCEEVHKQVIAALRERYNDGAVKFDAEIVIASATR